MSSIPWSAEGFVKSGDGEIPRSSRLRERRRFERGRDGQSGWVCAAGCCKNRILSRGFGRIWLAQPGSPWGVCIRRRVQPGLTSSGVRAKNPATKSSTMKGAKALGSKF